MSIARRSLVGGGFALGAMPPLLRASDAVAAQPMAEAQAPSFFRYRIGGMQVTAIHNGLTDRPSEGLVPNAPPGALQQLLTENFLPPDRFPVTFTTLVVNTGSKLVLIDTGYGDNGPAGTGSWMANFRAAGFHPANVDAIAISHFHADHISGYRLKDGTAPFARAELMVPAVEWDFWMNDDNMAKAPAGLKGTFENSRRVFGPGAAEVTRFAWDKEILPGITAIKADGHTPGHTAFALASGSEKLLVLSDTTNNPLVFARHPEWSAVFDQDAAQARATRRRLLDIAATERMQVSFYHAAFPATGHLAREGDGFRYAPLMWRPNV